MNGRMQGGTLARLAAVAVVLHALATIAPAAAPLRAARSGGQATQDPQTPGATFSSRADLVVLHVTVLDRRAGFVAGLPREAFTVYENGQPQSVSFFRNEDTPVTVGLVIDSSSSMHRKREAVIAAGLAFARSSHPEDELFTIHFNERVWHGLPPNQPFTSDLEEFRAALQRTTARGRTAFFDALALGLEHVERGRQQKKVLIVLSDGGDNASTRRFADVLDAARRSDTVIYTIGMADQYDDDADPGVLRELARATGAEAHFPKDVRDLTRLLERIARDIRSGYTIGYVPTKQTAGFHEIRVEVTSPDRKGLSVRARSGYARTGGATPHGAR
jgi:Ca-activated chloride channel homolog